MKIDFLFYLRVIILIFFISTVYKQFSQNITSGALSPPPQEVIPNFSQFIIDNPNDMYVNPTKYDQSLPLINRSASISEIEWATKFLRLPSWSFGYNKCDSEHTEVSCYELHRSAKIIERWENAVKSKTNIGTIFVNVSSTSITFPDKLSMLYHGLLIAVVTNRDLVTYRTVFEPISLPISIRNPFPYENPGILIETNHLFSCSDLSERNPNIFISGASWPQVLYTHPALAPKIREYFGFHAAHMLGNYLFGQIENPSSECFYGSPQTVIEGWFFAGDKGMLRPHEYYQYLPRCAVDSYSSSMVTNEINGNFDLNQENSTTPLYKNIYKFNDGITKETVCALRKITSAKKIVQTFGSRLGFWATALQGSKASFVNGIDKICTNFTNSQQGSLWHTYCPYQNRNYLYRANNYLFLCGNNIDDVKQFITYLLW